MDTGKCPFFASKGNKINFEKHQEGLQRNWLGNDDHTTWLNDPQLDSQEGFKKICYFRNMAPHIFFSISLYV